MAELDGRRQSGERAKGRDLIYAVVDEILNGDRRILLRGARLSEWHGLRRATREIRADIPVTALLLALGQRSGHARREQISRECVSDQCGDQRRLRQLLGVRVYYAGDSLRGLLETFSMAPRRARRGKTQLGVHEIGIEATP